ncbi:MAG: hypothetical protein U0271_22835 [Polyangiaceae bacterium]
MSNRIGSVRGPITGLVYALAVGCAPAAPQPEKPPPPSTEELVSKVIATYQGWKIEDTTGANCSVYFATCADSFARRAGFDPQALDARNPASFMSTPDPDWLPGWDKLPKEPGQRHVVFGALTLAASLHVHMKECWERFEPIEREWVEAQKLVDRALADLPDAAHPYERLNTLVRVRSELFHSYKRALGPRYAFELTLHDEFVAAHRDLVYDLQSQRVDDAADLRPGLPLADEKDLFCLEGYPSWQDEDTAPFAFVKDPIPKDRQAYLQDAAKKGFDLEQRLPLHEVKLPAIGETAPDPSTLLDVQQQVLGVELIVKAVNENPPQPPPPKPATPPKPSKKGGAPPPPDPSVPPPPPRLLTVELTGQLPRKDVPYDCKDDKASRVGKGGEIEYDKVCKKRDETRELHVLVHMTEKPDTPIQAGDRLVLLGRTVKFVRRMTTSKNKAPVELYEIEIEAAHVLEIWRHELLVSNYFLP